MSAPTKNKNAEKWTKEAALEFIKKVESEIEDSNNYVIGRAVVNAGGSPKLWPYLAKKFQDCEIVSNAIKRVEILFEGKLVNDTLNGKCKSAAMAIFYLKNKHGYKDKTEIESSTISTVTTYHKLAGDELPESDEID